MASWYCSKCCRNLICPPVQTFPHGDCGADIELRESKICLGFAHTFWFMVPLMRAKDVRQLVHPFLDYAIHHILYHADVAATGLI